MLRYLGHNERSQPSSMVRRTLHGYAGKTSKLQSYHKAASQALHAFRIPTYFSKGESLDHWIVACRDNSKEGKRQWSQAVLNGAAIHDQTWRQRRLHQNSNIPGELPLYQHIVEQTIPDEPVFPPPSMEILAGLSFNPPTPTCLTSVDNLIPLPLTLPADAPTYSIIDIHRCRNKRKRTLPRQRTTHNYIPGTASAHPPPLADLVSQNPALPVIPTMVDPALEPQAPEQPLPPFPDALPNPSHPTPIDNDELGEEPASAQEVICHKK